MNRYGWTGWTTGILALCLAVGQAALANVGESVRQVVASSDVGTSTVAYHVVDLESGEVLASGLADRPMIPASNMKLLTTGAAMVVLGKDFAFETRLVREGDRLIVKGSGDPGFGDPVLLKEMGLGIEDLLNRWADDVAAAGITRIEELIVDDSMFDDRFAHPDWARYEWTESYRPEVAGFNFHGNCFGFYARPGARDGVAPSFTMEPDATGVLTVKNLARTTTNTKATNSLWVSRDASANNFSLHGRVRHAQQAPVYVTMHDPAEVFADLFADRLRQRGVAVGASRSSKPDERLEGGETVGAIVRTPMTTVIGRCNTDSENLYAEALFKRLGREVTGQPGSWTNGEAVVRILLSKRLGPGLAAQATIRDGSGLSRSNRVTAELLTAWLTDLYNDETLRDEFLDSLAVGGESGTLRRRFDDRNISGRVLAKSGYIAGVSCLSGYLIREDGSGAAFAILVNDIPGHVPIARVKAMHEKIIAEVDSHLRGRREIVESEGAPATYGG